MAFSDKDNTLWAIKYRPDTFDGYIGNDRMRAKFASYIAEGEVPHILLVGPPGTGKTTAAKILVNTIECDSMILNASDENNIETVRTKIRGFASTRSLAPWKIMVLDEFDGFTKIGQMALRNLMETFSDTTRFILTANYREKVETSILSRVQDFDVVPPNMKDVALHVVKILKAEGVSFTPAHVKDIVTAHFPDIRKILNELQLATTNGVLEVDTTAIIESDTKLKVVNILADAEADKFTRIRQTVADANVRDFTAFYRTLFVRVVDFAPKAIPEAILAIAEGQYRDALVVDKEICFMATIIQILTALNT